MIYMPHNAYDRRSGNHLCLIFLIFPKELFDYIYLFLHFSDAIIFQCNLFCLIIINLMVYRNHDTFQKQLFNNRRRRNFHLFRQFPYRQALRQNNGLNLIRLFLLRSCLYRRLDIILTVPPVIIPLVRPVTALGTASFFKTVKLIHTLFRFVVPCPGLFRQRLHLKRCLCASLRTASLAASSLGTASLRPVALETVSLRSVALETASLQPVALRTPSLWPISLRTPSLRPVALETVSLRSVALETPSLQPVALGTASLRSCL